MTVLDGTTILCVFRREWPCLPQKYRKNTGLNPNMQNNENGCRNLRGQTRYEMFQCLNAACRRSDNYNVVPRHACGCLAEHSTYQPSPPFFHIATLRNRRYNSTVSKPRILIGDDHILIVEAIRAVLEEDFEVVGVADNGRDLAAKALRLVPDVVLLDISMPILNGIEAARAMKASVPTVHLIFLTQTTDQAYVQAALAAGASGYLVKQSLASELISALCKVLDGEIYLSPSLRIVPEAPGVDNHPERGFLSKSHGR